MSEVNVYGVSIYSSSGYDIGIDNRQYAIYKLNPKLLSGIGWLKVVITSKFFVFARSNGTAHYAGASV